MGNLGFRRIAIIAAAGSLLAACNSEGTATAPTASLASSNSAPTIAGTPTTSVAAASQYRFIPSTRDADGDNLTFSISGKPAWANFNLITGELTGTAQLGSYANIVIQVSDGVNSTALPPFTLEVTGSSDPAAAALTAGTGTAHLSWSAPESNTDGSPIAKSDLAGYRVYHGISRQSLNDVHEVPGVGQTEFTLNQLGPGTHYFAVSVVTATGIESALSEIGSKTIM